MGVLTENSAIERAWVSLEVSSTWTTDCARLFDCALVM